jgi:hypothetical protein
MYLKLLHDSKPSATLAFTLSSAAGAILTVTTCDFATERVPEGLTDWFGVV